jgi:serine-aspartate repeat-containing protein C/D/E
VIYIDLDNDGVRDANEQWTTTDASGNFVLNGLAVGAWKIREILPTGWAQTTPANNYGISVTVTAGQQVSGKLFGTRKIA